MSAAGLVLATANPHKLLEVRSILNQYWPGLQTEGFSGRLPAETGLSYAQNALIKARWAARVSGQAALADDSGIEVKFLGGMPGLISARWAGSRAGDQKNLELLLEQMREVPTEARAARYVCVLAIVDPSGRQDWVGAVWPGRLLDSARGKGGFGYDPVFQPCGFSVSAAELGQVKARISHRALALKKLIPRLAEFLA